MRSKKRLRPTRPVSAKARSKASPAPESANNAGAQTSFVPMLTLGLPSNPLMALMIGALMIQGIQPGPQVMTKQPELFWGVIASMWIGNLMLLIINLPMIGVWVSLLRVPYRLLFPAIVALCCIGSYSVVEQPVRHLARAPLFGLFGYFFIKIGVEACCPLGVGLRARPHARGAFPPRHAHLVG